MPHYDALPPIFSQYANLVSYVRRISPREFSSECIRCGGEPHPDGTFPDRCRWFLEGKPLGWCRRCGSLFWPDAQKDYARPSPEELAIWRQERIKQEEERKRSAERALQHLRDERTWERYHEQMDAKARAYWEHRGVPGDWQDFWRLGWNWVWHTTLPDGTSASSPTATIPLFDNEWQGLNVKHRLINTVDFRSKYRYEVTGQPQPMFLCDPGKPLAEHVIAVEGEIKAMVMFARMEDAKMLMVGLPGLTPDDAIVKQLAECERVTLVLDPGADVPVEQNGKRLAAPSERLAGRIGRKHCRLLIPTGGKIDDIILAARMRKGDVRAMLKQAVPV